MVFVKRHLIATLDPPAGVTQIGCRAPEVDFLQKTDGEAILAWVDNHCRSHPLDSLMKATIDLIVTLRENAAR
jgi:hypothetical protein